MVSPPQFRRDARTKQRGFGYGSQIKGNAQIASYGRKCDPDGHYATGHRNGIARCRIRKIDDGISRSRLRLLRGLGQPRQTGWVSSDGAKCRHACRQSTSWRPYRTGIMPHRNCQRLCCRRPCAVGRFGAAADRATGRHSRHCSAGDAGRLTRYGITGWLSRSISGDGFPSQRENLPLRLVGTARKLSRPESISVTHARLGEPKVLVRLLPLVAHASEHNRASRRVQPCLPCSNPWHVLPERLGLSAQSEPSPDARHAMLPPVLRHGLNAQARLELGPVMRWPEPPAG